jgi:hypothetical protein
MACVTPCSHKCIPGPCRWYRNWYSTPHPCRRRLRTFCYNCRRPCMSIPSSCSQPNVTIYFVITAYSLHRLSELFAWSLRWRGSNWRILKCPHRSFWKRTRCSAHSPSCINASAHRILARCVAIGAKHSARASTAGKHFVAVVVARTCALFRVARVRTCGRTALRFCINSYCC